MRVVDPRGWTVDKYYGDSLSAALHPVVERVEGFIAEQDLASHRFFERAAVDRDALALWASQELVMTNPFSQIVLAAASQITNVDVRAKFLKVGVGEHGPIRKGRAPQAHPWLLHRLCHSIGIDPATVKPVDATIDLIDELQETVSDPIRAVAAIGVGNERLIVPEYSAIVSCFEKLHPEAAFRPFLNANLTEDVLHANLCYEAASDLIHLGASPDEYYEAAVRSAEGRWRYFDRLLRSLS